MELKNGEIYGMRVYLSELEQLDVPARVGYHLGRLIKKLTTVGNEIEASRMKLLTKYGEKGENNQISISPNSPNWPEFYPEYEGLMNEETDIDAHKVILPPETKIAVKLLMTFEAFLEVVGEEAPGENGRSNDPVPMKGRASG